MKCRPHTNPMRKRGTCERMVAGLPRWRVGLVSRRAAILAVALATLLVVALLAGVVLRSYLHAHRQMRLEQDAAQSQWLAESALARAAAQLRHDSDYASETWRAELVRADGQPATGVATITIKPTPDQPQMLQIVVESRFPDHPWQRASASRTLIVPKPNDQ